jgi:hypothetical protein
MSYLTLDQLVNPKNLKHEEVEIEELGVKIRLAELNAGRSLEFKALEQSKAKNSSEDVERKQMVVLLCGSVVDEDGRLMLNEKTANQFINAVSFRTLQRIVDKILKMSTPEKDNAEDARGN